MITIPQNVADAIESFKREDCNLDHIMRHYYIKPYLTTRMAIVANYIGSFGLEKFVDAFLNGYKIEMPDAPSYNKGELRIAFNYTLNDMKNNRDEDRLIYIKLPRVLYPSSISLEQAKETAKTLNELVEYYEKYIVNQKS